MSETMSKAMERHHRLRKARAIIRNGHGKKKGPKMSMPRSVRRGLLEIQERIARILQ